MCVCVDNGGYHKREFDSRIVQVDSHSFVIRFVQFFWVFYRASIKVYAHPPWTRGGKGLRMSEGVCESTKYKESESVDFFSFVWRRTTNGVLVCVCDLGEQLGDEFGTVKQDRQTKGNMVSTSTKKTQEKGNKKEKTRTQEGRHTQKHKQHWQNSIVKHNTIGCSEFCTNRQRLLCLHSKSMGSKFTLADPTWSGLLPDSFACWCSG